MLSAVLPVEQIILRLSIDNHFTCHSVDLDLGHSCRSRAILSHSKKGSINDFLSVQLFNFITLLLTFGSKLWIPKKIHNHRKDPKLQVMLESFDQTFRRFSGAFHRSSFRSHCNFYCFQLNCDLQVAFEVAFQVNIEKQIMILFQRRAIEALSSLVGNKK